MSEEGSDVYKKNLVNKFKVEDTRGVGIPYPARTGGRRLAEEMVLEREKPLINEGITFNAAPKDEPDIGKAIKEVFDEMSKDENLVDEINEEIKKEETLNDVISEVKDILKKVNLGEKKMNESRTTFEIAAQLIKDRQLAGGRMGMNDDLCNTNLISKNYSPMFIRKFNAAQLTNWPLYVSMICDEDVSDIDQVVNGALKAYDAAGLMGNNLQNMRNLTGIISESLSIHYNNKKENCVEGIAVTLYIDKAYIQSFTGDFMNHAQCRSEYTAALNMMTQI